MVLTDLPTRSDSSSDLEVVRFEGSEEYGSYIAVSVSISGADESVWRTWSGAGLLEDSNVVALAGYLDGTPVAKAMSIRTGEVVGIYDVGTAETARRRRYGWAMTRAAIVAGASSGPTSWPSSPRRWPSPLLRPWLRNGLRLPPLLRTRLATGAGMTGLIMEASADFRHPTWNPAPTALVGAGAVTT